MSNLNEVIRRAKRRGGRLVPWRMFPGWSGPGMYSFRDGSLLVREHNYKFARVTFVAYACGVKREGRSVWQPSRGVSVGCITHIGGL